MCGNRGLSKVKASSYVEKLHIRPSMATTKTIILLLKIPETLTKASNDRTIHIKHIKLNRFVHIFMLVPKMDILQA